VRAPLPKSKGSAPSLDKETNVTLRKIVFKTDEQCSAAGEKSPCAAMYFDQIAIIQSQSIHSQIQIPF